ncbi:hypothetical protein MNBD_GAMMA26-2603 [hydrothermal vent metagenome]|uniref:Uncharacterized protein n=1 Tax=hydrothermal vent metagenome TaxID=652676 RepID=A0A3B1AW37_9ZZZZ
MIIQSILLLIPAIQVGIVFTAMAVVGYLMVSHAVTRLFGKKYA